MSLNNLSIARRLALVLGLILALSLLSSIFSAVQLRSLTNQVQAMLADNVKIERAAADWLRQTTGGVQRTSAIAKSSDPSLVEYFASATAEAVRTTNELQKLIEAKMDRPEERQLFDKIGELRKAYLAARDEVSGLKKAGNVDGAAKIFSERFEPLARDYIGAVQALTEGQRKQVDAIVQRTEDLRDRATFALLGAGAVSLVAGVWLAWLLATSITRPLRQAEAMAGAIARMDLTGPAASGYGRDETGRVLQAMDQMRHALTQSLQQVRGVADGISTASSQIAVGNQDLSSRTEQTASNLQQTASSMEELTGTLQHSADSAAQANQLASSAAEVAQRGGAVVSQVVTTMGEIHNSSQRIADIIGTIDGIAFQTNILALNAAVEAARAGEQGRGFAVVAGEVRSLASRSAEAAREIKALIGQSVERVETGSRLVGEAGGAMDNIVGQVKRVSDLIAEIGAATHEQSQGIGQVGDAIGQLDRVTQQNAALVEESAAAADSLKQQALRLTDAVAVFKVDDSVDFAPVAPARPSTATRPATKPVPAKPVAVAAAAPRAAAAKPTAVAAGSEDWESF
ncbi:MAG: methyl-accepting chemotaxis protein [Rubrivivax sp.]